MSAADAMQRIVCKARVLNMVVNEIEINKNQWRMQKLGIKKGETFCAFVLCCFALS